MNNFVFIYKIQTKKAAEVSLPRRLCCVS